MHNPLTWSGPLGLAPHSALITGFRLQTHPEISDPTKGDDLYGLPGSTLDEFQDAIVPGSGKIIKNGSR